METAVLHPVSRLRAWLAATAGLPAVRDVLGAGCFYLLLAVILAAPFLFFHQTLYLADMTYNNEPAARFMREWWQRTGYCPLWNPLVLCGAAQIQVLWPIAYMAGYLYLLLPFGEATGVFLALHFLLAGLGGYLWQYCKSEQAAEEDRHGAAVLFGTAFMLCGYMTSCSIGLGLLAAAAWIPWVLFVIDRLFDRRRPWGMAALALVAGQQVTSGRPELVALSWLLYVCYFLFRARAAAGAGAQPGTASAGLLAACGMTAAGLALAVSFAAVDLLPLLDLTRHAPAVGSLATLGPTYWSTGWYDFLTMVLSQPLGPLGMAKYHLYPTYPGTMPYVASLYLGPPVLTLAAVGLARSTWKERWFWLGCCLVALIVSAGQFGGVVPLLARLSPDLLVFRFPIKIAVFLLLGLCACAAEGWRAASMGGGRETVLSFFRGVWLAVSILGIVLLTLPGPSYVGLMTWFGFPSANELAGDRYRLFPIDLLVAGLSGQLICLLSMRHTANQFSLVPRRALILLVTAGLLMMNGARHLWRTVDSSFYDVGSEVAQWLRFKAGQDMSEFRVLSLLPDPPLAPPAVANLSEEELDPSFMQYLRCILKPNSSMDFGIQLSNGVSTIPSWIPYFITTGPLARSTLTPQVKHPAGKSDLPLQKWCQSSATRFVITSMREAAPDGTARALPRLDSALFKLVREDPDLNMRIFEVPSPRPRWSLMKQARKVRDGDSALMIINRCDTTGYDPNREVLIRHADWQAHEPAASARAEAGEGSPGNVRLISQANEKLVFNAENATPAYLVVADSFDPGWEARDNGVSTPVYLADGLMRAVRLEPGKHEVVFSYKPRSLFWGEVISKATLLLIAGILIATAVWRRLR
jgi:hypothetical protein